MRKARRPVSLLLSIAMMLSLCSVNVMADDAAGEGRDPEPVIAMEQTEGADTSADFSEETYAADEQEAVEAPDGAYVPDGEDLQNGADVQDSADVQGSADAQGYGDAALTGVADADFAEVSDPDANAASGRTAETGDAAGPEESSEDADAQDSEEPGEDSDPAESGEDEEAGEDAESGEDDEYGIMLLADGDDAPATYEAAVVYFDEYNNRISDAAGETVVLNAGSVKTALEDAGQESRTYDGNTYDIDWVYDTNSLKVMETAYLRDSNGDWQLNYSLSEDAVGGQTLKDGQQLEIWYTYHDGSLPVSYSPAKPAAGDSANYVDGAASVMAGETLTFSAYLDQGYSYTVSVTAGGTSLPVTSTAASKEDSGETVYTSKGDFTVEIPADTTDEIIVSADYTHVDTVTFDPGVFADTNYSGLYYNHEAHFSHVNNNGESNLEKVEKDYSDEGVEFTFEFETDGYFLYQLQINGKDIIIPSNTGTVSATTTLSEDPGGDSSKDCKANVTFKHTSGSYYCTTVITVTNAKEDITITSAALRGRWEGNMVVYSGEGVVTENKSTLSNGRSDTSKLGDPMVLSDYRTVEFIFGLDKGYKDLSLKVQMFHSTGELESEQTISLSNGLSEAQHFTYVWNNRRYTLATVEKYNNSTYPYEIVFNAGSSNLADAHIYFEQLYLSAEPELYDIVYVLNNGSDTTDEITDGYKYDITSHNANVTTDVPTAPEGKVFYGWSTEDPTGKDVSSLTIIPGGEAIDILEEPYYSLIDRTDPTKDFDGTLRFYAVYVDALPDGTTGQASVETYLQDSTGAYNKVDGGTRYVDIIVGESYTLYDDYINQSNPNVDYGIYTYYADPSTTSIETATGNGDELCLYYSLDFKGNVSVNDRQYGDGASDPTVWVTVADASGQESSVNDSKVGSAYTAGDPVYYAANEDGSKGQQLDGVPTVCGSYIAEVTWTQQISSSGDGGRTITSESTFTGSGEFKITQREITVTTGSETAVFNGEPLTDSDYTITEGSLADGDSLTMNVTGSQTSIGSGENTATVDKITDAGGNDVTDQYQISLVPGTLTVTAGTTSVTVTKVWDDNKNQDGIRPENIEVQLYADGAAYEGSEQMSEAGETWTYTWDTLPIYPQDATGLDDKIDYTVEEVNVADGYTASVTGDQENGFTITNTHTPETVSISGTKIWDDDDNNDGCRPESITINLHADNKKIEDITVTPDDNGVWSWTFEDLPKYDNGTEIVYSVTEDPISEFDHYKTTYENDNGSLNVINTHDLETTTVTVLKAWDDANDQDGIRPDSITVQLYADGELVEGQTLELNASGQWKGEFEGLDKYKEEEGITYTVEEAEVPDGYAEAETVSGSTKGYVITNTHTPEVTDVDGTIEWDDAGDQDGIRPENITVTLYKDGKKLDSRSVSADADGNWTFSFTELPKYDSGVEIEYTVAENELQDYETRITGDASDGFVITNTHTPETVSISGTKTWDDADNQDGIRPASVTVNLIADGDAALDANGEPVTAEVTSDEKGNWNFGFENLPKYKDKGESIVYTVEEVNVADGYTATVTGDQESGFTITNTHTPEVTEISGSKTWDDDNNNDGYRPASITIRLLADGSPAVDADGNAITAVVTPDADENWTWSFPDLPKYDAGKEITYTLTEDAVDHYATTGDGYDFTNRHTPDQTSLTVTVAWDDSRDQDGIRPDSVTLKLLADGADTGRTAVLSAFNNWSYTITGLDMYEDEGNAIAYTVEEADVPDGYTVSITGNAATGYTVTDTHTPETVEIDVEKIWDDADDQDGKRPDTITVNLLADGVQVDSMEMSPDRYGNWGWNFTDKPEYRDEGVEIAYTVTEDAVEDYDEPVITGSMEDGFTITNTHTPETVEISGSKTWDDDNNNDGDRPESITIRLLADGSPAADEGGNALTVTVTGDTDDSTWGPWEFANLPKYDAGKEIVYTVTEDAVANYSTSYDGCDVTNTHTPDQTSLTVTAAWDDSKNQDGIRPDSVTLKLLADGEDTGQTAVLNADNNWTAAFTGIDIYEDEGKTIAYTVEEAEVPDGYTVAVTGDAATGYTVTNTHTPETAEIDVNKIWDDAEDQDGKRPAEITVNLLADGKQVGSQSVAADANGDFSCSFTDVPKYRDEGTEIVYTVDEDTVADYDDPVITGDAEGGFTITNTHTPETVEINAEKIWDDADDQDGRRPTSITINLYADETLSETVNLSADMFGDWGWTFTDKPKYSGGKEITYTVTEDSVADYDADITGDAENGIEIRNTHIPETVDVSGSKTWDDDDNNDGIRPASITIRLLADGSPALDENGDEITAEVTEADNWSWSFTDLPKYSAGKEITYTITEDAEDDYSTEYDSYDVTNTHTPDQTSLTVTAAWDDDSNRDGIRPGSITIKLLADGEDTGRTVALGASNSWSSSFTGLNMYKDGGETIVYTVEEADVPDGYTAAVTGDAATGYIVTDTHTPATTSVSGSKTWDDDDNNDGDRPDSITIRLLADGSEREELTVSASDNWSWSFTDLPKYKDEGTEIVYTITEDAVAHYSAGYDGFNVTNTHTPDQTSVTVTKVWDDKNDQDGIRPDSVTVKLMKDGADTGQTLELNASNNWKGSFTGLDLYEDEGETVRYTVEEAAVPDDYSMSVSGDAATGYIITNTHTPETIDLPGYKTWDDYDNDDRMRPDSITIRLYADGREVDSLSVTEDDDDNWTWVFADKPKYSGGKEITYTITEDTVDHYATGYNNACDEVINVHTPDQTSLTVSVAWDDQDNRDGIRPDSITLKLLADGEDTGRTIDLSDADNWRDVFTGLDINYDGVRVRYTVEAADAEDGYEVSVTGTAATGYTLTFKHVPETVQIAGSKTWIDDSNNDGDRPDSITIRLYADGIPATDESGNEACITVTEADNWSWSFTGYDKYKDGGTEIVYTITEDAADNYSAVIDGFDVTNTHTPDQTSLTVTKVWDDKDDRDGIRPESVTVNLLADGENTGNSLTLDASGGWTGTFTGIDMYRDEGTKVVYTVEEAEPEGYFVSDISGDQTTGYRITNTHVPETVDVSGSKIWNDGDDVYGLRPDSITINLLADGEPAVDETAEPIALTVTEADGWAWSFTGLPRYRDGGTEIVYSITEEEVYAYTSEVNGYDVTNTINPAEFITGPGPETNSPDTDGNPNPTDGNPNPTDGNPSPTNGNPSPTNGSPNPATGGKTGDNNMFYFWVILMCAGAALVVTGVTLRTRSRMRR